jgi:hypothetical protein
MGKLYFGEAASKGDRRLPALEEFSSKWQA